MGKLTFNKENVEADEWTEFDFSATTNDLSTRTFTSDNEEVLVVKGNKAMGESFTLAGFETATIKNITWAEALLG